MINIIWLNYCCKNTKNRAKYKINDVLFSFPNSAPDFRNATWNVFYKIFLALITHKTQPITQGKCRKSEVQLRKITENPKLHYYF